MKPINEFPPAPVPATRNLKAVREAASGCRACPLWKNATQTVFGAGRRSAALVLVGEQPGDQEDLEGQPFVGPAGRLLNRALEEAGIDRDAVYVTNAVKHFKWAPQGKRRLHQKPSAREIAACRPWLEAELRLINPDLVVCLGATAAASVIGPGVKILKDRGRVFASPLAQRVMVTIHPSLLLRLPEKADREREFQRFVDDLRLPKSR